MYTELVVSRTVTEAGIVANGFAAQRVFADYRQRKSSNSLRAHKADLATYAEYLSAAGIAAPSTDDLQSDPKVWAGCTWGLTLTSVNRKLSTVKAYAQLAAIKTTDVNLSTGELRFYRPKVGKTQTHRLTKDAKAALVAYMPDAPALGPLLRGSIKGGELAGPGMTERAITMRVGELGERIGVDNLSAHDLRHYWATRAIRKGSDPFAVLQAGGWTSMATVQKYVDETEIANAGIAGDD